MRRSKNHERQEIEGCHLYIPFYYIPKRIIGRGAFGVVVECVDLRSMRRVAVKKILTPSYEPKETHITTLRELVALKHLRSHRNIVELKDVILRYDDNEGEEEVKEVYFVMEYLPETLSDVITRGVTEKEALFVVYQLLIGIRYIHNAGLAHRDIKPKNILVDAKMTTVKYCDFGLTVQCDENNLMETTYVVTRAYRAPELCMKYSRSGKAVDIWAIGCILAEMMMNRNNSNRKTFFHGHDTLSLLENIFQTLGPQKLDDVKGSSEMVSYVVSHFNQQHVQKRHSSLRDYFSHCNADLVDLVERMLQMNPEKRITAKEALDLPLFSCFSENSWEPSLPSFPFYSNHLKKCEIRQQIIQESYCHPNVI